MIQPAPLSLMPTIDQFWKMVALPLQVYENEYGREDETMTRRCSNCGGAILLAFGCLDGVWVGLGALEAQEPFVAK